MSRLHILILQSVIMVFALCFASEEVHAAESDSIRKDTSSTKVYAPKKSPTTAILYSCVFPGLGQYYVESYWKIPLFTGGAGVLIYAIAANNSLYSEVQADITRLEQIDNPLDATAIALLKREREVYRDRRDLAWIGLGAVYIVAAIDAYTGAHLYDFDVSDKIAGRLIPNPAIGGLTLSLRW